jgi:hypothetical protein
MGILKMVDYMRGSHNVYKERYTDPALWQKEFDADICFWLKFNVDWYESVILSKEHLTIEMKSIKWDNLRSLNIPAVNEAIDICHAKGLTSIMALNYDWNEEVIAKFYANLYVRCETKTFHWLLQGKCRMDLPGPTTSVGTRTDYSVGPWDYTAPGGVEHKDYTGVVLG